MGEVLAIFTAVPAISQLVGQTFNAFSSLRAIYYRNKKLTTILTRHGEELISVQTIVQLIEDERDLQTKNLAKEVVRMKGAQARLGKMLKKLDPSSRSKINQTIRNATKAELDDKDLLEIMNEIRDIKMSMLVFIQGANIGVARNVEKQYIADATKIERIDELLKELSLDNYEGLRIAQMLKGRRKSNDGTILLTPDDLRSLGSSNGNDDGSDDSSTETLVDEGDEGDDIKMPPKRERIILDNMALHDSCQINGSIGKDIWEKYQRLEIRNNCSKHRALQINYGITTATFEKVTQMHTERLRVTASQRGRSRHDSVQDDEEGDSLDDA